MRSYLFKCLRQFNTLDQSLSDNCSPWNRTAETNSYTTRSMKWNGFLRGRPSRNPRWPLQQTFRNRFRYILYHIICMYTSLLLFYLHGRLQSLLDSIRPTRIVLSVGLNKLLAGYFIVRFKILSIGLYMWLTL